MLTVGVFAAVFDAGNRILCVKRNYGPRNWTLPGGRMESGESPIEALERETEEETGYRIEVKQLIGIYSAPFKDDVVLFFAAETADRRAWQPGEEISELRFFGRDELPPSITPRTLTRIQDAYEGRCGVVRVFDPE